MGLWSPLSFFVDRWWRCRDRWDHLHVRVPTFSSKLTWHPHCQETKTNHAESNSKARKHAWNRLNKAMHFCAITHGNEGSLFDWFKGLQSPKIVLTVVKKACFSKLQRPLDPQLVFTWAAPLFLTVRRPCLACAKPRQTLLFHLSCLFSDQAKFYQD